MLKQARYSDNVIADILCRDSTADSLFIDEIWRDGQYFKYGLSIVPNSIVLDIGAHIGIFSILAARLGAARVISYEPISENYDLLLSNVLRNGINNIEIHQRAISDKEGKLSLHMAFQNSFNIDISELQPHEYYDILRNTGAVSYTALDGAYEVITSCISFLSVVENLSQIDFLKMDIEGGEYVALYSLPRHYYERIRQIGLEFHLGIGLGNELVSFLRDLNYNVHIAHSHQPHGMIYAKLK